MSDIDDFLDEQKSQGRLESAGGFSVDWVRAEALMSKNLLTQPDQWIVKIVQTLVRDGPEEIEILHVGDRLNFLWKLGLDPSLEAPGFSGLFSSAALKHLKVGLASYQGFGGTSIIYFGPNGKTDTFLGPEPKGAPPKVRADWNCLSFKQIHKKGWFGLGSYPTGKMISSQCGCSPIPISLDGKQLTHPLSKSWSSSLYLRPSANPEEYTITTLKQSKWERPQADPVSLKLIKEDCLIWAVLEISGDSWSESRWVIDGVATGWERNTLDRPGWHITMSSAGLATDLTGLDVVNSPEAVVRRKKLCQLFADSPALKQIPKDNGLRDTDFI